MIHKSQFTLQETPSKPGVYVFRNHAGEVIYVGKAKNLRKRLAAYFQPSRKRTADIKVRALINSIEYVEVHPVARETEAYLLESRLVKQYNPRYNVELRDDKRFLLVAVDPSEPFPRLRLTRLKKDDGRLYFGPFPRAGALRQTVNYLAKVFRLRTCNVRTPDAETRRHCIDRVVRECSCPCTGDISAEDYNARLEGALRVLRGQSRDMEERLEQEMTQLAARQRYEDAARTRDILENLRHVSRVEKMRTFERATLSNAEPRSGMTALQEALGLPRKPDVIECFDVSNIGGYLAVASMVCFRNGKPAANDYRRFRIRSIAGSDDFAMIAEAVARRYRRVMDEGRPLPSLVVIDGGKGQLRAAIEALQREGIPPTPVMALAKKREEVFLPGRSSPVCLSRHDPGLQLLQAVRDEAHRFALAYHHTLRRRRIADSVLAEIEGVGPARQTALLKAFGSVTRLRRASAAEIAEKVPGLGHGLATVIADYLRQHAG